MWKYKRHWRSHKKNKAQHDHHRIEKTFKVEDRVWLHLNKERLQVLGMNIKALQYGPFDVLEKVGDNVYKLSLPPYMCIYLVVNMENVKLYEPSMLDYRTYEQVLPTIQDLVWEAQGMLVEYIVL